ncbi:Putative Eukaryotic translation initiation factor 2-alpha kinase [Halyomorpha halys]|nr:Putative Eukaryotic translation initiation factor 2-alpha kinase [Halyomorpha halys]
MLTLRNILVLIFISCFACFCDSGSLEVEQLPFCNTDDSSQEFKKLLFVSTLDGRLSALNIEKGGAEKWSITTGPMLSSSIHTLELTNNGQFVRMIPSLSGGLYKFNGDSVEAIPITADNLLKSSFLYSDDLVISGGRESKTYGVEVSTGKILYECSMSKCDNESKSSPVGDVIVVQRQTQTIRAIEPRSGAERWNFSVGQHDVKIAHDPSSYCHSVIDPSADYILKVIVPDGLICAISKTNPGEVVWKHKFEYPVVSAWQVIKGQMKWVDLFGGSNVREDHFSLPKSPVLYIGMHNKQESVQMQRKVLEHAQTHRIAGETFLPRIPWRPVPGNGYFLYSAADVEKAETGLCSSNDKVNITIVIDNGEPTIEDIDDEDEEEKETPVQVIMVSFWYWWKEVLLTSISTAILLNVILQRRLILFLRKNKDEDREPLVEGPISGHTRNNSSSKFAFPVLFSSPSEYVSRYLTDFEPVHCLGKGGFGVVFQAKNKIDDCHYAIKRIPLPNKEESRERVMREVKALAKLDHQNIVRYFNAWLECPPPNWQETQDALWAHTHKDEIFSDDAVRVDLSSQITPSSEIPPSLPIHHRKQKNVLKSLWEKASSFYPGSCQIEESIENQPIHRQIQDVSDSYIVFEGSSKKEESFIEESKELSQCITNGTAITCCTRPSSLSISSGPSDGRSLRMYLFIQMQLCRKESLRDWLSDNLTRDKKQIMHIFDQIVQAVEYVHLQGLIHRDLKPSNIFFSPDGQVKVGDFGLVTAMVEGDDFRSPLLGRKVVDERHTARVGTQLYMSPEQHELLKLMLSQKPEERPTTIGVRSRPPLRELQTESTIGEDWHFSLPARHRDSSFSRSSQESSS